MYIPKHFEIRDWNWITEFVAAVGAVDLVTVSESGFPIATVLPVIWDRSNVTDTEFGTLIMHMAIQNEQWRSIAADTKALAIVHGPQSYISPSNYENKLTNHRVVPTWNYEAVHLSGTLTVSQDPDLLHHIVSDLTDFHETKRAHPWSASESDPAYFAGQLKAIVAVEMKVTKVEAKAKLSQNRSVTDQQAIVNDLKNSSSPIEQAVGQAMQRNLSSD